eukprot:TRINITY_DN9271_c0_g1_i1.p1 TRINITY_DN9271_c0_g1~~TRINITY_DN9271_c0_g1_i1.p1  ORF type:complete len:153 (-),score=34.30 TRINITY_DN9271_c0_g1_i1:197-655(-)
MAYARQPPYPSAQAQQRAYYPSAEAQQRAYYPSAQAQQRAYAHNFGARYSGPSEQALGSLANAEQHLESIEDRVADIDELVYDHLVQLKELKTELAQLESSAKQLETGVDDVYTGELHSGRAEAKLTKKDMLKRLEGLFSKCDEIFASIKKA